MVICRNVSKRFSERIIINSFSYTFDDTGMYLLLGESGSGKTTFLNILSGMVPFENGTIIINGDEYRGKVDNTTAINAIEYITQESFFADYLSVMDNLKLVVDDEKRITNLLAEYKLEKVADQLPATLSGGEKQRIAIIRALLNGKTTLLLDEPTASLDEDNKRTVFQMLANLSNDVLIICTSHDRQAIEYADHTITFSKSSCRIETQQLNSKAKSMAQFRNVVLNNNCKSSPNQFLKKWFASKYRSRKSSFLFYIFLVLAFSICLFADTPENKEAATLSNLYEINMLTMRTYGNPDTKKIRESPEIIECVLEYSQSCPDGNENLSPDIVMRPLPDYEVSLYTLPYDKDAFRLSRRLKYGNYFSSWNEIIISAEMACAICSHDPGSLVGEKIQVNVFDMGVVEFTITGIFDYFTDIEKKYLQAIDIYIASGEDYNREDYSTMFFVNSKFTEYYENNATFFSGNEQQRGYRLYFKSYNELEAFYKRYNGTTTNGDIVIEHNGEFLGLKESFHLLFITMFPMAVFLAIFATLFYTALRRIEYLHNSRFIAVFEYSGYKKADIVNRFIWMNIIDLIKYLVLALLTSVGVSLVINYANRQCNWISFQIFSYNPWIISTFILLIAGSAWLFTNLMYRRIKVDSWYDILIDNRDLL